MPRKPAKIKLGGSPLESEWNAMVDYLTHLENKVDSKIVPVEKAKEGVQAYVKVCLEDNTECFVKLRVIGPIYRTAGGTYTQLAIEEDDIPDGNNTLI